MKNADYWAQRFTQLEDAQNQQGADALKKIEAQYRQAQKQLEAQISTWYQRFAKNNGITLAEARQWLTGKDLKEFKWDVQDYIKYGQDNALSGGWMKELENASAKYHISKLEALKIHTQQSLESLFSKQGLTVSGALSDVYTSGYYHTVYELQKGFNIGWDIAGIDEAQLEKVLAKPWAADGYNFSERIWKNKDKLISEVHNELSQNIMLGADPQKAIDALAKKMNTSKHNAGRLVMTEEAYFSSTAQKEAFQELGVEQFEIVATLDSHTSEICRMMDGKHFPMTDFQPGATAPPFHVYCRSTTVPYFDDDFGQIGERAARDEETGKTYYIPDDMKYQDWEDTFVNGGDKSGFDVLDDGSALHYSHHKEPEPEAPPKEKKVYLTEKKLNSLIADADVQLEDLENQFKTVSGGWTYDEAIKDFGSLEDFTDGDDLTKLKDLHSQMEALAKQKEEWTVKLNEKLIAKQKKALAKEQIDLEAQKEALQQQLDDFEIKTYSGIWYNKDVTTADWAGLNIQGKKQFYEGKFITETDPDKMKEFQELYKQVQELDTEGKAYHDIQAELQKVQSQIQKVQSDLQKLENGGIMDAVDDAFTQARKDAAMWAKSTQEADKQLRKVCGDVWQAASRTERHAIYDYTSGSGKFNRPLSGFQGGWGNYNNKGVGNVDLNYEGAYKEIKSMTDIISKSTYDFDVWLQRGCGTEAIESFLGLPNGTLGRMTHDQLQQFVDRESRIFSFTSTGVAKGKGFSGNVIMNIYAPKGTQMMYAEPFSAFGNGGGKSWNGIDPQSTFGYESEMIIQRGAYYRITKIEKSNGTIYIDLEVHPEKGYEFVEDMPGYKGSR
jgi:SPP1 gp7 family putative phage head morphogenesis protein